MNPGVSDNLEVLQLLFRTLQSGEWVWGTMRLNLWVEGALLWHPVAGRRDPLNAAPRMSECLRLPDSSYAVGMDTKRVKRVKESMHVCDTPGPTARHTLVASPLCEDAPAEQCHTTASISRAEFNNAGDSVCMYWL